mgnify:CR=1 FL=1
MHITVDLELEVECDMFVAGVESVSTYAKFLPSLASTVPLIYTIRFASGFVQESTFTSMQLFDAVSFAGVVLSVVGALVSSEQ